MRVFPIAAYRVRLDSDTVHALQRIRFIGETAGFSAREVVRIATATSEIVRNAITYAKEAVVEVNLTQADGVQQLQVKVVDQGPGIENLTLRLAGESQSAKKSGRGLMVARKLMDEFDVLSEPGSTRVTMSKRLPAHVSTITGDVIRTWLKELETALPMTDYAEVSVQNQQLTEAYELLAGQERELQERLEEIGRLNAELNETNTGIVALYTEVETANEGLKKKNEELGHFAYVVSHDLQEPLRMISSYVQLLARRYKDKLDAEADEFIHYAVDGAERMQAMINDILMYSRVGTKGKPFAPVEMQNVLSRVRQNLQVAIQESGAAITHDSLPVVVGDDSQLVQLLQNLIGNAIKYRKADQRPQIHVTCTEAPKTRTFSVKDNGIGIESQYVERIFRIFQRLHARDEYEGTGIGLAVCRRIVERHGGRIWVESVAGEGSTFYFTIPGRPAEAQAPEEGSKKI